MFGGHTFWVFRLQVPSRCLGGHNFSVIPEESHHSRSLCSIRVARLSSAELSRGDDGHLVSQGALTDQCWRLDPTENWRWTWRGCALHCLPSSKKLELGNWCPVFVRFCRLRLLLVVFCCHLPRSSSREVRIKVPFFSVAYFSRGTLSKKG